MKRLKVNARRILILVAVLVLVLLMMDFNNRMGDYLRLRSQDQDMQTQVAELQMTQADVSTQIAYATSDVAVEEWAREQAGMAQTGDVPIQPVSPPGSTPVVATLAAPTQQPISNWQVWQALFFGK